MEQVGDRERKLLGWKWVVGWRVIGAEWCGKVGVRVLKLREWSCTFSLPLLSGG